MKNLWIFLLTGIISHTAMAFDCQSLVEKVYTCGERKSYSSVEVCDTGDLFEELHATPIDDLAIDSVLSSENILTCDFSYPVSYTGRCYGSLSLDLDEDFHLDLSSYRCFDLETGKKI